MRTLIPALVLFALSACTCGGETPEDECATDADCTVAGETCVAGSCTGAAGCSVDAPCGDGTACVADDAGSASCEPITGDTAINDACTTDVQCSTGACSGDVCVALCSLDTGCVTGLRCVLDGFRRVCVPPLRDGVDGDVCDDPRQCLSGTCVRPPDAGTAVCTASCDDAHACADDGLCLELDDGARACLAPLADGVPCNGADVCAGGLCIEDRDGIAICASACVDDACAAGFACIDDADDNRICMPLLDDRADGEACTDLRECVSQICADFGAPFGRLCASECPDPAAERGGCDVGEACYPGPGVNLCGPV